MIHALVTAGTADPAVVSQITTGAADLLPTLLAVGGIGIGVSLGLMGLKKGFGFFRGLVRP